MNGKREGFEFADVNMLAGSLVPTAKCRGCGNEPGHATHDTALMSRHGEWRLVPIPIDVRPTHTRTVGQRIARTPCERIVQAMCGDTDVDCVVAEVL